MSTLEEHLSEDVAVILVIVGIVDGKPHVLLVHRSATPQEGKFALPGGKWKRTESLESSALHFAISVIGVLIFVGLTAYDTQKVKEMYLVTDSGEVAQKKSILGALTLYMDFIGIFIYLMMLFGNRE